MTEPQRYTRGRLSRGKGLRKTTGCVTCRKRHVKCDEAKPRCGGCARQKVRCEYSNSLPETRTLRSRRRSDTDYTGSGSQETTQVERHGSDQEHGSDGVVEAQPTASLTPREQDRLSERGQSDYHVPQQSVGMLVGDSTQPEDQFGPTANDDASLPSAEVVGQSPQANIGPQAPDGNGHFDNLQPLLYGLPSPGHVLFQPGLNPYASTPDSGITYGVPLTTRWLDLLIGDATLHYGPLLESHFESDGTNIFGNSVVQSPIDDDCASLGESRSGSDDVTTRHPYLQERIVDDKKRLREKDQAWKALEPLNLQKQEHILFRHFTDYISQWLDLFEPRRPFGTLVPHLALRNVGLMNAILALAARHLDVVNRETPSYAEGFRPIPNDIVGYYYKTLHYCQKAMQYDTYQTSLELLSSAIIISTYEMLDGSTTDWEKHLKGVFWIQRSQVIHGHSGGLRQAVWWAWLCQDVWAAFREKRKPLTFWKPNRSLAELDPNELAARSIYNFAQVVGFCAEDVAQEESSASDAIIFKAREAELLFQQLEHWRSHLTLEFNPISMVTPASDSGPFPSVWIQPAAFAVSMQSYYCSMILLHLHRPCCGGYEEYLDRQRSLRQWASTLCGIAKSCNDRASYIIASQFVFIAGLVTEDRSRRMGVLDLLDIYRRQTGWPSYSLGRELQKHWGDMN